MPISLLVLEVKFIDQRTDGRTRLPFCIIIHFKMLEMCKAA